MKLIFDWCSSFYEKKNEWRGDEEIISLEIFQKESGFAVAKATIDAKNVIDLLDKKYAQIGVQKNDDVELLFSGRLIAFPVGISSATIELELISEPDDYQTKLSEFLRKNFEKYRMLDKHSENEGLILFDDLFFSSRDLKNPTIFLEGSSEIFHWDMRNGDLTLSDINHGRKNFYVYGNEILQDSIRVRISREPYKVVNLKISANWIQHEYGIIDLFPMIAEQFERRLVNSFTNIKPSIENLFSEKSGYRLIHCNIREINPNITGLTRSHPMLSPDLYMQDGRKIQFKRFYFDGKLIVSWAYKQKRIENVNIRINNPSSHYGREKNLYCRLNAIQLPKKYPIWNPFSYYGSGDKIQHQDSIFECMSSHVSCEDFDLSWWNFLQKIPDALTNDMSSSFFSTARGKNAIRYALQKAIALINYSSRHIEIDFCVGAEKFISVSVDDQITIYDKRFRSGSISGKITRMRFIGNADRKIMKFTIGCCTTDLSANFEKLNAYEITIPENTDKINPVDIVQKIEVKNTPEEQMAVIIQMKAQSNLELKDELRRHATKIKLSLHPLNTTRTVTREINLPDFEMEKS